MFSIGITLVKILLNIIRYKIKKTLKLYKMKTYLFILVTFFLLFTKVSYGILPDREYRFFPEKLGFFQLKTL